MEPHRGREETSSFGVHSGSSELEIDDLDKIIKSLSQKFGKLEIENKYLSRKNSQMNNWGYNKQYRRPPLQLLPRERKEQLDQIMYPLYLEDSLDEQSLDTQDMQGNIYGGFAEEKNENMAH